MSVYIIIPSAAASAREHCTCCALHACGTIRRGFRVGACGAVGVAEACAGRAQGRVADRAAAPRTPGPGRAAPSACRACCCNETEVLVVFTGYVRSHQFISGSHQVICVHFTDKASEGPSCRLPTKIADRARDLPSKLESAGTSGISCQVHGK